MFCLFFICRSHYSVKPNQDTRKRQFFIEDEKRIKGELPNSINVKFYIFILNFCFLNNEVLKNSKVKKNNIFLKQDQIPFTNNAQNKNKSSFRLPK